MSTPNIVDDPVAIAIRIALTDALASFPYGSYDESFILFDKKPNKERYRTFAEVVADKGINLMALPTSEERASFVENYLEFNENYPPFMKQEIDGVEFDLLDTSAVSYTLRYNQNEVKHDDFPFLSKDAFPFFMRDEERKAGGVYDTLAQLAMPEQWHFGENDSATDYTLLKEYLDCIYRHLQYMDAADDSVKRIRYGVYKDREGEWDECIFNTGLLSRDDGEEICILLTENNRPDSTSRWRMENRTINKNRVKPFVTKYLNPSAFVNIEGGLPEFNRTRDFYKGNAPLQYGGSKKLSAFNITHVALEHCERLPITFLKKHFEKYPQFDFDERKNDVTFWREVKRFLSSDDGAKCLSNLSNEIIRELVLQDGIARASNGSYAVKVFYDKHKTIEYFLPLYLDEDKPKVGIICSVESGWYFGRTLYTPAMAYKGARMLGKVVSSWFSVESIDPDPEYIRNVSNDMNNRNSYK